MPASLKNRLLRLTVLGPGAIIMAGALVACLWLLLWILNGLYCFVPNELGKIDSMLSSGLVSSLDNKPAGHIVEELERVDVYAYRPEDPGFMPDVRKKREPIYSASAPERVFAFAEAMADKTPGPAGGGPLMGEAAVVFTAKDGRLAYYWCRINEGLVQWTYPNAPCVFVGVDRDYSRAFYSLLNQQGVIEALRMEMRRMRLERLGKVEEGG